MMHFSKRALTVAAIFSAISTVALAENPNVGGAAMYDNKTIVDNAVNSKDQAMHKEGQR